MHILTRDGWFFLAMGYNGARFATTKEDYLKLFNRIERAFTDTSIRVLSNPQDTDCFSEYTEVKINGFLSYMRSFQKEFQ